MRSLIWTGVFCLLLIELGLTLILSIPLPRKIRNWIVLQVAKLELKKRFRLPLTGLVVVLCFALLDTSNFLSQIYSRKEANAESGQNKAGLPKDSIDRHILKEKEYRASRNMYLAGFALTLLFVIGRIMELMKEQAELSGKIQNLKLALSIVEGNEKKPKLSETSAKIYSDNDAPTEGIEMKPMSFKKVD